MYSAARKNTARISVLTFLTSSHSIHSVSIHFINPLLTRRAQDFDFKSHLRVWKPLLSSKCLPLGHCYYYMLICIYIFYLEAALYLLSPIWFFFLTLRMKTAINVGRQQELTAVPIPVTFLQPFLTFYWLFFKLRGLKPGNSWKIDSELKC